MTNKFSIPSWSGLHPVETSHWPILHSHKFWHLIPYVGNGHFLVQFSPLKPDIQTEIVTNKINTNKNICWTSGLSCFTFHNFFLYIIMFRINNIPSHALLLKFHIYPSQHDLKLLKKEKKPVIMIKKKPLLFYLTLSQSL